LIDGISFAPGITNVKPGGLFMAIRLLSVLSILISLNVYSESYSCKEYESLSSTQINTQIARAFFSRNASCMMRDAGYDLATIGLIGITAPLEMIPILSLAPYGIVKSEGEIKTESDLDEISLGVNLLFGSILGPAIHDSIGGLARIFSLGGDFIDDGLFNDKRNEFKFFRGVSNSFPATQARLSELSKDKDKNESNSFCQKYLKQLTCLLALKDSNSPKKSASRISQTQEIKNVDYLTIQQYSFRSARKQ
jgi:hypothetical protein